MTDLRGFLRLQTDAWLISLRDKLAEDLLANRRTTSFSYVGKSGTSEAEVPTADIASQLADILVERNVQGAGVQAPTRMTIARFV